MPRRSKLDESLEFGAFMILVGILIAAVVERPILLYSSIAFILGFTLKYFDVI